MSTIVIAREFRGPPNSGNGGFVCGVLAKGVEGPARSVLRAPIPIDVDLTIEARDGGRVLLNADGAMIAQAAAAPDAELPVPPPPPSLDAARKAGAYREGVDRLFHRGCFTCGMDRTDARSLRLYCGPLEDAPAGHLAGVWRPDPIFADVQGTIPAEVVWAALDCSGHFAWCAKEGLHGGLLGTMTCEVLRLPKAGEDLIVTAWPLEREGRKQFSGTALFTAAGELLARSHHVWVIWQPREGQVAERAKAQA